MFSRVLVANRGEIALRVIRACKELGIETVAIFSEADRGSQYLELADQAFCVGSAKSMDSYLRIDRVIAAAELGKADAIHPGYGFLAENSHFNEVCRSCNFEFIGPSPEAMEKLGDKNTAREMAIAAGVPVVPGSDGLIESEEDAINSARKIGFPVLIKATAGGGGKGMRVALDEASLQNAVAQAQTEAKAAFGNPGVYLERYIDRPRHVEVQIIADQHGNVVHLHERDCSVQRRHQKLIEESPSPRLPESTRKAMCDAAVRMVKQANYYNAATVEFIVDQQDNFYFIEVNARIQVEHPVSEMVSGIDLIKTQILVASGQKLGFKQSDIKPRGAAIECRINAEDPYRFTPSPGRITAWHPPGGPGIRVDSHAYTGYVVPPHYDSMIGKVLAYGDTREQALRRMRIALSEMAVEGILTNLPLHRELLADARFVAGGTSIHYLENKLAQRRTAG